MSWRRTTWEIRSIDMPELEGVNMRVLLTVDTDEEPVIDAIETAADRNGIMLHRIETDRDE